jgi:hypothetical protein
VFLLSRLKLSSCDTLFITQLTCGADGACSNMPHKHVTEKWVKRNECDRGLDMSLGMILQKQCHYILASQPSCNTMLKTSSTPWGSHLVRLSCFTWKVSFECYFAALNQAPCDLRYSSRLVSATVTSRMALHLSLSEDAGHPDQQLKSLLSPCKNSSGK